MKYASVEIPDDELSRRREEAGREFEQEKKAYQERYPDKHWYGLIDNFPMILPHPDAKAGRTMANFHSFSGSLNTPQGYQHPEGDKTHNQHSKLWLDQTPAEFYAVVDAVIENTQGVSRHRIEQLQHIKHVHETEAGKASSGHSPEDEILFSRHNEEAVDAHRQLNEYALPVYLELRAIGYTRKEIAP